MLSSITPGAADRLFSKLKAKTGSGTRTRTALLSVQYCRRAWNVARREKPDRVPLDNPFTKTDISYTAERTRPVSHSELVRFVEAAVGWANSPVEAPMVGNGAIANLPTIQALDSAPLPTLRDLRSAVLEIPGPP